MEVTDESRESAFESELAADRRLHRIFEVGSWTVSLSTILILLILLLVVQRNSAWLVLLSAYSVSTRLLMLVEWKALMLPRFLLHLDESDSPSGAAARVVFERHRAPIVRPLLAEMLEPADDEAVAGVTIERVAKIAREHDIDGWRRIGRITLIGWAVASVLLWGALIATRGMATAFRGGWQ